MVKKKPAIVSAKDQIYESLKQDILSNKYQPGDIIQIDRIAAEYGVSATPIREILLRLEGTGLIVLIPNKGAQVNEIKTKDIKDIWEIRKVLECYAGRISAQLISEQEIDPIMERVKSLYERAFDKDVYTRVDDDLHRLLYSHIDNEFLCEAITRVQDQSLRIRYYAESVSENKESIVREVSNEHLDILKALKLRDPDLIEKTIRYHLENGERRTIATVEKISKD